MTEKQYSGSTGREVKGKNIDAKKINKPQSTPSKPQISDNNLSSSTSSSIEGYNDYIKAGKIASQVVQFAKSIIKKDLPLLEIANNVEAKIIELGGKLAFPVNLSINEIAAHYTPTFNDTTKAHGLLKVDIGVHVNGHIADTAFSIDLENSDENKKLIESAELALKNAISILNTKTKIRDIGKEIEKAIKSKGFQPIINLCGHSLEPYQLHSGVTIPNCDNHQEAEISSSVFAIEPFSTAGFGCVRDGKPSGIYHLEKEGSVRDSFAREVLAFIEEEYQTLPFSSRQIYKKFGSRGLLALKRLEDAGLLHHYPQLIEKSGAKVAQAEHTILLTEKEKIVTTA